MIKLLFKPAIAAVILTCAQVGCADVAAKMQKTWYQNFGWRAGDYFDDPKVIELCHAIEAKNVEEVDRLVAAGASVNAQGKDNMTPLLWAFPG